MIKLLKRCRILALIIVLGGLLCLISKGEASAYTQKVRVGIFELNGFYEKTREGMPVGYGIEYLNKIAENTGWEYEYIWAENWDECVELLRAGQVDLIAPSQKNQERMDEFEFSAFSIGMECGALLALDTNETLVFEDYKAFSQIRIGCVDTLVFKDDFMEYAADKGFTPSMVSYRDTKALMAALNAGEVDAALVNLFVKTDTTKVLAKFGAAPFYYMLRKNNSAFLYELDAALQQINIEFSDFETQLMEKYYPSFNAIPFTKAELEYVESAPVFVVGCRTNIRPLSYEDEKTGQMMGINRELLDHISRISGLRFEYAPIPEGPVEYSYLRDNGITLISCVEYNEENISAPGIRLTSPYLDSNKVFVCKKESEFDIESNMKVAVATGSETLARLITSKYPQFELQVYTNMEQCFEAVRLGHADALLQNQYVVATLLAKPLYADMAIIPIENFKDQLCLSPVMYQKKGVKDALLADERLISILNKSIRQIPSQDISRIIIKQTAENQYQYTVRDFLYQYRYMLGLLAAALLLLLFLLCRIGRVKQRSMNVIRRNEAKLKHITDNINGGVVVLTAGKELHITYANEGFLNLLQCGREEYEKIKNREYTTYVHPDDQESLSNMIDLDIDAEDKVSFKIRIMRKDGCYIPALFNGTLAENEKGEREIYCVIMDISEQERLMEEVSLERKKYGLLIENSGDIVFEVDYKNKKLLLSPLFEKKFGWKVQEWYSIASLHDVLRFMKVYEADYEELDMVLSKVFMQKKNKQGLARLRTVRNDALWCRFFMYPMMDTEGGIASILGIILDVNEEIRTREELELKSRTDELTGMLNKAAFYEEAKKYLSQSDNKECALVFIDIDNFKQVNDRLGHLTGDRAIKDTAKKLQVIFSNYDLLSRFGGDEFCLLLKEIPEETLQDKLSWTVEKLRGNYTAKGEEVGISVSVGAVSTSGKKKDFEFLLDCADKALYNAKENGKNQYVIYYDGM